MSKIKSKKTLNKNKFKKFNKNEKKKQIIEVSNKLTVDDIDEEDSDGSDGDFTSILDHKKSLQSLKEKDSEFYEFLQKNDKQLLDFDVSDEDLEEDNEFDEDLDESETNDKITVEQIDEWSERLRQKTDIESIKSIVKWFRKAVNQTSGESDGQVLSSETFNAVINVCLIDLLPAIHKLLKLPQIGSNDGSTEVKVIDPTKSRKWKKVISVMKCYLTDVIKMVGCVSQSSLTSTLLRHILHLIPFIITFPHLIKRVLKQTLILWSESDEKNRILSFICILRLIRTQEQPMISFILKKLYISYIKNSKFTTKTNWSSIQFMRHSLVELYSLDSMVAYQHSFVFIRQLAINLRTALTIKKKNSYKSVFNWQYLHSILLWTHLLSTQNTVPVLEPLICPLVNVIIGTIRLMPSIQFFPMRFHLIKALIRLSEETNVFIPVLPLITEVFDRFDKIKKNKSNEEKELNFDFLIKVSKLNSCEFEFRNSSITKVYDLVLHYLSIHSNRIAFPELVQISVIKIRKFLKRSHVIQQNQLLRQLLDKIEENSQFICQKRRNIEFSITDSNSINSWERQVGCDGTPLNTFYNQRQKFKSDKEVSDIVLDTEVVIKPPEEESREETVNAVNTGSGNDGKKRKHNESRSNTKTRNKSKRSRKVNEKQKSVSFEFTESLNISSDESN